MAFATIETTSTSFEIASATTHNITLPSGLADGDLAIAFLALDGTNADTTWPSGWTEIKDLASGGNRVSVAYRFADGTEGATVDPTTSASRKSAHTAYRISGHDSANPPEISTGVTGGGTTIDPDSLSPTGGSDDYVWLAIGCTDGERDFTVFPSGYGNILEVTSGSGSFGTAISTCDQNITAASEDPGTFTYDVSDQNIGLTLAIFGLAPVGVPKLSPMRHPSRNFLLRQ